MKSEEVRGKRKMQIYVDGNAVRSGNGQKEYPFQTISEAAKIARPGDEVLVAPGVYREYVDPANAGCEDARIVYRSVEPGKAVITGAEIVDNWEHLEGDVWTARVSNGLFVESVYGAAAEAGMRRGDIIISAGGKKIRTEKDLNEVVSKAKGSLAVLVDRNGSREFIPVKLSDEVKK